ncbi:MAG: NAD(P)H-hydrate dehydratase [Sulfolobales archaeon]
MVAYRMKVCSVSDIRRIDELASSKFGIDSLLLMENAGTSVFSLIKDKFEISKTKFLIVAGTGNNGGDALVVARRLYAYGGDVRVVIVGDPGKYREPANRNYEIIKSLGINLKLVRSLEDLKIVDEYLTWCDVVVVGLIGVGLKGEVSGIHREVITRINSYGKVVVSVDIPSGINADNGAVCGVAVKSNYTVTFGNPKYGNVLYPGYHYCGELYVSRLSYPPELYNSDEIYAELNVPLQLPERVRWGHKGTFGKFLAVAGSKYYYGAPYYVSYSFLKAGGGYSRLAAPKSVVPYIASRCSEVVYIPLEETQEGSISAKNYEYILSIITSFDIDIVALGPGMSTNYETQQLIQELTESIEKPLIIDGDGITAVARDVERIRKRRAPTILTPHLAEFSRITGLELKVILEDPVGTLRKTCKDLKSYIVLKGAHTLIGNPEGYIYVNMTGNPGMAKAGSGDVLTGTIAAMYGIGFKDVGDAVRMGVLIHGLAGDLAAETLGEDGITPDDILNYLPNAIKMLREDLQAVVRRYMPKVIS